MFNNKIICIFGSTCTGKTDISIKLSKILPCEIISVDSSMVYKYMNIGTNKPSLYLLSNIKHNLINIRMPRNYYSVFDFYQDSIRIINNCWENNKIPLFVGGTMMYFWILKNFIERYCNFSSFLNIAIMPIDKYKLYNNIKKRFYIMIKNGFIEEVDFLRNNNYIDFNCKSINSIGYKELWLYLDNKLCFYDVENAILKSTYNLAKKQLFWIKKWKNNLILLDNIEYSSFTYLLNLIYKYVY